MSNDSALSMPGRFGSSINRSLIGAGIFWCIILFQFTVLKYMWNLELLSRNVNFLMLAVFWIVTICSIFYVRFSPKVWYFYLAPGLMVLLFQTINIVWNSFSDPKLISQTGLTLPWVTFMAAPILIRLGAINARKLWKAYYYFILVAILLALVEYFLVLTGKYTPRMLTIPNGVFLSGKFVLFHMLEDGTQHDRFYACLGEPGDLAMFLIPAITYAILNRKFLSVIIFLIACYFTRSLGGFIGLFMIAIVFPFYVLKTARAKLYTVLIFLVVGAAVGALVSTYFLQEYEDKGGSRETREQSVSKTIYNIPIATVMYPFGMPLRETTADYDKDKLYFGSNFTPGFAFVLGGIFSFLGYCFILLFSLYVGMISMFRKNLTLEQKVVFSSLVVMFTFVVQRSTVWDSSLFGCLYSPYILNWIDERYSIG